MLISSAHILNVIFCLSDLQPLILRGPISNMELDSAAFYAGIWGFFISQAGRNL